MLAYYKCTKDDYLGEVLNPRKVEIWSSSMRECQRPTPETFI